MQIKDEGEEDQVEVRRKRELKYSTTGLKQHEWSRGTNLCNVFLFGGEEKGEKSVVSEGYK